MEIVDRVDAEQSHYLTAQEIANAASPPIHLLRDQAERIRKYVQHLMLVGTLRFFLLAILEWEWRTACGAPPLRQSSRAPKSLLNRQSRPSDGMSLSGNRTENGSIPLGSLNRCPCFWPKVHRFGHLSPKVVWNPAPNLCNSAPYQAAEILFG